MRRSVSFRGQYRGGAAHGGERRRTAANDGEACRRRDLAMEIARLWVKRDEGVFANLKKRSAWSGDHRRRRRRRETAAESSPNLKKKATPVGIFDGALA